MVGPIKTFLCISLVNHTLTPNIPTHRGSIDPLPWTKGPARTPKAEGQAWGIFSIFQQSMLGLGRIHDHVLSKRHSLGKGYTSLGLNQG